jgi:ABC-type Fe3+-hydroxamate transport system substrate-binding protein
VCAVACLTACGQSTEGSKARGAPRVVSLHDVTTEMVVALGATDHLVGVAEPVDATPEVARAVQHVPRVGGLESILLHRPDVLLGLAVVEERDPDLVARLRERGVDVYLADPATLDDVYAALDAVAERTRAAAAGDRVAAELRNVVERGAPQPARRVRVFVYDCCDPPFTAGGKTVLTDLVARAGGHNIFSDVDADWTHVSWEEVVARRPELVVIHSYKYEGQGDVPDKERALRAIPSLSHLPTAVVPLGCSLGGLRSAEGFERLRAAIHERTIAERQ